MSKEQQNIAHSILDYCKKEQKHITDFLADLVRMESPSHDKKSQQALLDYLENCFQELNFFVKRVPGKKTGGYLYSRPSKRKKGKPCQLLLGHSDTVWKKGSLKEMPLTINGKMTGPGVYDMKAGLAQLVFALKVIQQLSLELSLTPLILINTDEEIGSLESTEMIVKLAKISNRVFVMEPPLGIDGKLKTARKGIGRFTITVKGKAAHAGLDPGKGISAIVELSHQVQQLFAMNDFKRGITVNVGTIQGGISPNVVAPESTAVVDVRVLRKEDGDEITKKIFNLKPKSSGVKILVEGGMGRPPMEQNERNQKLWHLAKAKALLLGIELEQAIAGGGSDGNTTSKYAATLDGLGTTGDGAHAKHEFIYVDQLAERTALLALLILSNTTE